MKITRHISRRLRILLRLKDDIVQSEIEIRTDICVWRATYFCIVQLIVNFGATNEGPESGNFNRARKFWN